jgi:hypothetical protein
MVWDMVGADPLEPLIEHHGKQNGVGIHTHTRTPTQSCKSSSLPTLQYTEILQQQT